MSVESLHKGGKTNVCLWAGGILSLPVILSSFQTKAVYHISPQGIMSHQWGLNLWNP